MRFEFLSDFCKLRLYVLLATRATRTSRLERKRVRIDVTTELKLCKSATITAAAPPTCTPLRPHHCRRACARGVRRAQPAPPRDDWRSVQPILSRYARICKTSKNDPFRLIRPQLSCQSCSYQASGRLCIHLFIFSTSAAEWLLLALAVAAGRRHRHAAARTRAAALRHQAVSRARAAGEGALLLLLLLLVRLLGPLVGGLGAQAGKPSSTRMRLTPPTSRRPSGSS